MTTAASSGSDPVGYAVPIAKVTQIVDDLENGVVKARYDYGYPAFLGVALSKGTTVQGVYAGTPAAQAGLREGDMLLAFASTPLHGIHDLQRLLRSWPAGQAAEVELVRAGARMRVAITPREAR